MLFFTSKKGVTEKKIPNYDYIRSELLKNGISKKLLWTEYMEVCRLNNEEPLIYSQFCHYILQDEQKRRATMHISRKPSEQVEVDWAGDPAKVNDPDTGVVTEAFLFVGVMTYSQYAYVEVFINEKQPLGSQLRLEMNSSFFWKSLILPKVKNLKHLTKNFSKKKVAGGVSSIMKSYLS